jgi:hypothetical protein
LTIFQVFFELTVKRLSTNFISPVNDADSGKKI